MQKRTPNVYILNKGCHDFSTAEQYGNIVFCTEGFLPKYQTSQMVRELQSTMKDCQPDDYILLTSLTALCSIACALFSHKHGRLNLLLHGKDGYIERKIILPTL